MGIKVEATRIPDEKGNLGHHGIHLAAGTNNLVTDFEITAPQVIRGD